jgi:hypothetical protein
MDDAASGRHPLHVPRLDHAFVADRIAVLHASLEHDGDGLEAAMRMVREAGDPRLRIVGAELIEHEERIDRIKLRRADHALELDAGAVGGGHACYGLRNVSHWGSSRFDRAAAAVRIVSKPLPPCCASKLACSRLS